MKRAPMIAALALGIATSAAFAQQHQHAGPPAADSSAMRGTMTGGMGMMQAGGGMMMPGMGGMRGHDSMAMMPGMAVMMQAMSFAPNAVLARRDSLGLTAAQVSSIQALSAGWAMPAERMAEMRRAQDVLQRAFEAARTDTVAIRAATERLAVVHARMQASHLATAARVRGVLTAAQRERLAMDHRMGGEHGMPMMSQGPGTAPANHEAHHPQASRP